MLKDFLSAFSIVWPDAAEFAQAYELLAEHRLPPDSVFLIA
jgi:hypothetical protein